MSNYKIKVNNEAESEEVSMIASKIDLNVVGLGIEKRPNGFMWVYLSKNRTHDYSSTKEITLAELRDMVVLKRNDQKDRTHVDSNSYDWYVASDEKHYRHQGSIWVHQPYVDCLDLKPIEKQEMKEYVNKTTGEYRKTTEKVTGEQWVEVDSRYNFAFKKTNGDIRFSESCFNSYFREDLLWHRPTQPEELPFIDDEPQSLNNQYAEIEQVRQMEIHGNVEAEPDFNFGAAQSKGGVDSTLAERQSQYGCYEDVAQVTQQILSALRIGNYDKLPAPMKESLHMIASKMARIVNGDPKYLDNWHDIGGYAKLIEKLIKGE